MGTDTKEVDKFLEKFLSHKTFTTDERKKLAEDDLAMPDGSFPIRNRSDLRNAVQAYGRASDKEAVKKWIIKRAKALNLEEILPEDWTSSLEHHGVKGMKWGVRRADKKWEKRIYSVRGGIAVHNAAADIFNARIGALNARHPKADMLLSPDSPATKKYVREAEALSSAAFTEAVRSVHGSSPSGTMRARMDTSNPDQYQIVIDRDTVEHADDVKTSMSFEVEMDRNGKIRQVIVGKNAGDIDIQVEHSNLNNILEHYGVKGQKWGVRRTPTKAQRKDASKKAQRAATSKKRRNLSDSDIEKAIKRLEAERKLKTLTDEDVRPGRTMARRIASDAGQKAARTVATGAMLYGVKVAITRQFSPREAASYLTPRPKTK